MAETTPEQKRDVRDVLRIAFRRKTLFLLGASLSAIVLLFAAHMVPLKYTGTTIFERRTDVASAKEGGGGNASFDSYKLTMQLDLAGNKAIEQAIEELGVTRGLPRNPDGTLTNQGLMARQQLVQDLAGKIKITWEARSEQKDVVGVSFTHPDRKLAEEMPNLLVTNYINRTSEQIVRQLSDSKEFLETQVHNAQTKLTDLSGSRIEFEAKHAGMQPGNPGVLDETIRKLNADVDSVRRQQTIADQKVARLKGMQQADESPATQPAQVIRGPNPRVKILTDQIQSLKDQLDDAVRVRLMTDAHPTVVALRAKIAGLEEELNRTPPVTTQQEIYEPPHGRVDVTMELAVAESESAAAANELDRMRSRLAAYEDLQKNFAPIQQAYAKIIDELKDQQGEVDRWQRRLDEVQMSLAAEVAKRRTHLNAVQTAEKQFRASFPTLWMVLGGALLGGLAVGAGLVFLTNAIDRSIGTPEEAARHFGVPIHGVISEIVTPPQRLARAARLWVLVPAITTAILVMLAVGTVDDVLWLDHPQQYPQWKASPVKFVWDSLRDQTGGPPANP